MTCRSFQRFSLYLPDIFATMTEGTVWDPLRKKEVALTPEEHVRQWFIGLLHNLMHVPMHMMMSEVAFKLGAKNFRADILVYDRNASPLAVVECKRPETAVDSQVLDQAIRYNMVLDVRYIFITNGKKTFICAPPPTTYAADTIRKRSMYWPGSGKGVPSGIFTARRQIPVSAIM